MRLQLALNVTDLDESIDFYSQLFGEGPSKLKEGYANWSLSAPPLKLVLFERGGREEETRVTTSTISGSRWIQPTR